MKRDGNGDTVKDAFAKLEQVKLDAEVGKASKPTLQKMLDDREEKKDDFSLNQKMRSRFRA